MLDYHAGSRYIKAVSIIASRFVNHISKGGFGVKSFILFFAFALHCSSALAQTGYCFKQGEDRARFGLVVSDSLYPSASGLVGSFHLSEFGAGYISINGGTKTSESYFFDNVRDYQYEQSFTAAAIDPRLAVVVEGYIEGMLRLLTSKNIEILKEKGNFGASFFGGSYKGPLMVWPTGVTTAMDSEIIASFNSYMTKKGLQAECDFHRIAPMMFTGFDHGTEVIIYPISNDIIMGLVTKTNSMGGNIVSLSFVFFADR